MSEETKIEWADSSWNPWIGCTKVSPGCLNCYAEVQTFTRAQRAQGRELWGKGKARHRTSAAMWKQPLRWNAEVGGRRTEDGGRATRRVFPSMCDWLDEEVPIEWLADFLRLIYETPNLDWLLLTKRPQLFAQRMEEVGMFLSQRGIDVPGSHDPHFRNWLCAWHVPDGCEEGVPDISPPNVWLGTSVEDQTRANERIPHLLKTPAKVRFLSVEPLLGAVDLKPFVWRSSEARVCPRCLYATNRTFEVQCPNDGEDLGADIAVDWVIVGGESGRGSRPCNLEWIRAIIEDCKRSGVACFVKQLGAFPTMDIVGSGMGFPREERVNMQRTPGRLTFKHPKGGDMEEWPEELRVREFPNSTTKDTKDTKEGR